MTQEIDIILSRMSDEEQLDHYMNCRLGHCCSICSTFIGTFKIANRSRRYD